MAPKSMNLAWPQLKYENWRDTLETLQLWMQIVGKLKLSHMPWANHSWNSTFYIGSRGFVSSGVCLGSKKFETNFDFTEHTLIILTSDGGKEVFSLESESVAEFWTHFTRSIKRLGIEVRFVPHPCELPDAIPFAEDKVHCTYDRASVERFWEVLLRVDNVLQDFRADFAGKCSPVHFFWGSFDLAHSRFSGREAPEHPGGVPNLSDRVVREAYSHEVSSCGFWPGNAMYPHASFYSYCYPEPKGFSEIELGIDGAFYHPDLREFIFPYEEAIRYPVPGQIIRDFFQRASEAAVNLGGWDRILFEESSYLRQIQAEHLKDQEF